MGVTCSGPGRRKQNSQQHRWSVATMGLPALCQCTNRHDEHERMDMENAPPRWIARLGPTSRTRTRTRTRTRQTPKRRPTSHFPTSATCAHCSDTRRCTRLQSRRRGRQCPSPLCTESSATVTCCHSSSPRSPKGRPKLVDPQGLAPPPALALPVRIHGAVSGCVSLGTRKEETSHDVHGDAEHQTPRLRWPDPVHAQPLPKSQRKNPPRRQHSTFPRHQCACKKGPPSCTTTPPRRCNGPWTAVAASASPLWAGLGRVRPRCLEP
ncbi:hypothetical protein BD289DRAFT_222605 [Coniella lustricola]|uniref:Uncharacterized protein n=1 Tax=Coniella lustricola TaxID=2025994 RepID=A0A2T3AB58_9PEZI|nr:hypothetical protein BD289DRAFT_222605 [Coniella lustricola]